MSNSSCRSAAEGSPSWLAIAVSCMRRQIRTSEDLILQFCDENHMRRTLW